MPKTLEPPALLTQVYDLLMIELTNWRWSWRSSVIVGALAPLLSIVALGLFARDSGPRTLAYILTGNAVISLMFGNMDKLQSHFCFIRFQGTLDYLATLPIRRYALIVAAMLAFLLLSLPSLAATVLLGSLYLRVPLHLHPLLLAVVPLCALPLAGIGALIGTTARGPQEAGSLSLLVTLALAGLGPVVVPPERLPGIMLALGRLSPATYAASALRQALLGPVTGQLLADLAVLAAISALVLWLVGHKMDWRQR